jgi:DNA-binding CsgD family transcriptional regulator
MSGNQNYQLFFDFIKAYSPSAFQGINPNDALMEELEERMKINNQFLFVADMMELRILFTSKNSKEMIGILPEDVRFSHFMNFTHPDDRQRLILGRTKLIKSANDMFIARKGDLFLSANLKMLNSEGTYSNFLIQNYLYYTEIPNKTVFYLKLHTKIDWYKNNGQGFHYYVGNDLSNFRYPDQELMQKGSIFSNREFEIIQLVALGFNSEQIAEKLFLSLHTVNTHRHNILKKSEKSHFSALIFELRENGLL